MHWHVVNRSNDRDSTRLNVSPHLWFGLPENPWCWLAGHRPYVHRLPLKYPHASGETEYRWVECRVCGRRSDQQVPPSPHPVNYEGIARGTDRRDGWRGRQAEVGAEFVVPKRPRPEFSARFHLGSRGSETPVDAHLTVAGAGVYANTSLGHRFADWVTRGEGRDLSLAVHGGHAYWKLWVGQDGHPLDHRRRGGLYRSWYCRDGSISVNLFDYLHGGPLKFSYADVDGPRTIPVVIPGEDGGDVYDVTFTLQRQTRARPRGPKTRSWVAEWKCERGIPVRNHEWKGDCILGSAVHIERKKGWLVEASEGLRAQVARDRAHYDWRPTPTGKVNR